MALQPDFAAGRLILAAGVSDTAISEARGPWHVAVCAAEEAMVYDTLQFCEQSRYWALPPYTQYTFCKEQSIDGFLPKHTYLKEQAVLRRCPSRSSPETRAFANIYS